MAFRKLDGMERDFFGVFKAPKAFAVAWSVVFEAPAAEPSSSNGLFSRIYLHLFR
jgi:hypothetical protein